MNSIWWLPTIETKNAFDLQSILFLASGLLAIGGFLIQWDERRAKYGFCAVVAAVIITTVARCL